MRAPERAQKNGDLSVTALYTSAVWSWGGLKGAELLASDDARRVFDVTNAALGVSGLVKRDVRSLRHGLLQRHTAIDRIVERAGAARVLELAAGLSRRGVARTADPSASHVEIDLAPMIAHKRRLLDRTEAGRAALARANLRLVEGDVTLMDLASAAGDPGAEIVIAEGLFMYLDADAQRALWAKVRRLLDERGGALVFDLVPASEQPPPGLPGRALGWMMRQFTGGRSFERDQRTRDDIARELTSAGFDEVEMIEPGAVARDWGLPHPDVPTAQLLFIARVRRPRRSVAD